MMTAVTTRPHWPAPPRSSLTDIVWSNGPADVQQLRLIEKLGTPRLPARRVKQLIQLLPRALHLAS